MRDKQDSNVRHGSRALHRRGALKAGAASVLVGNLASTTAAAQTAGSEPRTSALGVYRGFSRERFEGWKRISQYITTRDGTRLAADIFRPTTGGVLHDEPLPVIWEPKRYQRAVVRPDGTLRTTMDSRIVDTQRLLRNGYVIVAVDRRGTGASFGVRGEFSDPLDARDGYDVTEWLAVQPWSSGQIGMFGASYEGEMQLRVAGTAPPHLKAITPEVSPFDWYWIVHTGGVYRSSFENFATHVRRQDLDPANAPVDGDADRALLRAALAQHAAGNDYRASKGLLPYRDSVHPTTGEQNWLRRHGGAYAEGLSKSGVAVYHRVGWFAGVLVDQLAWYVNQKAGPKKMLVGPWGGRGAPTADDVNLWSTEVLRFFDYWLKGVQNGVMDEPPIHSSVPSSHVLEGTDWRGMWHWPPRNQQRTEFYFDAGASGTVASVNDGRLSRTTPEAAVAHDDYVVRFDLAYGPTTPNQPTDPAPRGQAPVDHSSFDAQGLTYTSEALIGPMEVTGHPVVRLWLASTATDGDVFVKLQDVDENGVSTFITDGVLRASRRALGEPPYDYFGVPWTSCREDTRQDLTPGVPVELTISLNPTSYILRKGHRFRVTITGSDAAVGPSPVVEPAPVVRLFRDRVRHSSITLPIIPPTGQAVSQGGGQAS